MAVGRGVVACGVLLMLGACGSGGGGGSPPATSSTAADSNQAPIPFQSANTTVTYPVDSAAASFSYSNANGFGTSGIAPSGSGSTITISTDANDHISQVAIAVSTGGVIFNATYPASSFFQTANSPISLAAFAGVLETIGNDPTGTSGFLLEGSNENLNYATFGAWMANDGGGNGRLGVIAGGSQTVTMPTSGSATYTGTTIGVGSNGNAPFALEGNAQILANFGTGSVTTTFSGLTTQDLNTNAIGSLATQTGSGTIAGNKYSTAISGGGLSGTANGTFYGPSAAETAGVWKVSGSSINAMGSFGAHQ